jgi:hypothetical protein
MANEIIIIKNNHLGREVWRYRGKVIGRSNKGILVEAFFNRSDLDFNGIVLKQGDRFLEFYPFAKHYNVCEIYDRDSGKLKAWYCNVTHPVHITTEAISYDDLALDLLVYPDGRRLVLDEDEFNALGLDEQERKLALQALCDLENLFSDIPGFNIKILL